MRDVNHKPRPSPTVPALHEMLHASDGILDLLPIATCICDARGVILQYNRRVAELWDRAPQPGQRHDDFIKGAKLREADGAPVRRSLLTEVLTEGKPVRDVERLIERADGLHFAVSVNIDPLFNTVGDVIGAVYCVQDITQRKRATDALEQSRRHALEQEQRLAATYEHAAIGIAEVDPTGQVLRVNETMCGITGYTREEILAGNLFRFAYREDSDSDREAFRKQVAGELEFYSAEKRFVRKDGRTIWIAVRSSPVRDATGHLLYMVRVVQDITESKIAEQRQKMLIDELNHRVKNTLATVQSLASQTARHTVSPREFGERFEGRLIALSKAHDQLTMHHWESADLRELLSGGFAPYSAGPERVVLRGEDVRLRPRAVLTLAMVFHELITNAAKYGALSVPAGRVEIRWRPERDVYGQPFLRIDWQEEGGPAVAEPEKHGFGSRLIEGSIAAELGGSAQFTYAPEGLRGEILVPRRAAVIEERRGRNEDWGN